MPPKANRPRLTDPTAIALLPGGIREIAATILEAADRVVIEADDWSDLSLDDLFALPATRVKTLAMYGYRGSDRVIAVRVGRRASSVSASEDSAVLVGAVHKIFAVLQRSEGGPIWNFAGAVSTVASLGLLALLALPTFVIAYLGTGFVVPIAVLAVSYVTFFLLRRSAIYIQEPRPVLEALRHREWPLRAHWQDLALAFATSFFASLLVLLIDRLTR